MPIGYSVSRSALSCDGRSVRKVIELAEASGVLGRFPADLKDVLSALFAYRNKMLHHDFEWPLDERTNFDRFIVAESWPQDWFDRALSGSEPWIFYLSPTFIGKCFQTIDDIVGGFGAFVRDEVIPRPT